MEEKKVGEVIKFFGKIGVAAIRLTEGGLKVGDKVRFVGHTTDLVQTLESIQIENQSVPEAGPGADIGVKVTGKVREHDAVHKVVESVACRCGLRDWMKITVKVKPNSKENGVEEIGPHHLLIKVKAPPREDKANREVVETLAEHLHVPKSRLSIVAGRRSKQKVIEIEEG